MAAIHIGQEAPGLVQAATVIAWHRAAARPPRPSDWIERTMARVELPGPVDLAKNPDTARRLSRLLGL